MRLPKSSLTSSGGTTGSDPPHMARILPPRERDIVGLCTLDDIASTPPHSLLVLQRTVLNSAEEAQQMAIMAVKLELESASWSEPFPGMPDFLTTFHLHS